MTPIKSPAAAGTFYPAEAEALRRTVRGYLDAANGNSVKARAIIVPHAGYRFSGAVAASAYARIRDRRNAIHRVVLLGPSHYLPFNGLAVSGAEAFATPLGVVPLDAGGVEKALSFPQVHLLDEAFSDEHAIEVHLPFLQETLGEFSMVPLLTGDATLDETAEVIEALWEGGTLIVASSDLSHFHPEDAARKMDFATSCAIENFLLKDIGPEEACGHTAVKGLLKAARERGLTVRTVDLRNSGDTAGLPGEVVGYGAFLVF